MFKPLVPGQKGGFNLMLASKWFVQTPRAALKYGCDGQYTTLSMRANEDFVRSWNQVEAELLDASDSILRSKFGSDFNIRQYFIPSVKEGYDTAISLPVYVNDGKTSTNCFDKDGASIHYTRICAGDHVVARLELQGIWLKHERAGLKLKVCTVKQYEAPPAGPVEELPLSDNDYSDGELEECTARRAME